MQLFRKPQQIDFYSVNLFRVTDIEAPKVAKPPPPPPPPVAQPVQQKPQVKPAAEVKKVETPKVTSLSPQKVRKKEIDTKVEKLKREEALAKRMAALKANMEAQKLKEEAKEAAKEAISKISQQYQKEYSAASPPAGPPGSGQQNNDLSDIEKAYLASVHSRILQNWILPDLQNWENDIEAVVVLTIDKSGSITKYFFEKKSNNQYFDKFVEKAIQESDPLPPFPAEFKEKQMEIGLRFYPGGLL